MSARIRLTFASFVLVTTVGAAAIAVSGAGQSRAIQDVGPRIQASLREIPSPAPADSAQPQLTVSPAGRVLSSWLERVNPATGRRRFRLASLDGDQWSPARTIVEGDRFFANWADVPSIAAFSNGSLAAHWLQMNGPGRTSYDVLISFSRDDGKSWTTPATPHRDGTET